MNIVLLIVSIVAIGFGIYWYFIHVPNYEGYISVNGESLKKYLKPKELLALTQNTNNNIWILDVREEEYFLLGHIPTAKNFPYDKIEIWYSQIPSDKQLILYCDLSLKTQNVIDFLEQKDHTQLLNWGKYNKWKYPEVIEETILL